MQDYAKSVLLYIFKCDFWIRRQFLQLEMSVGHHKNHFESLSGEK